MKFLTNPLTQIASFCIILISGDAFGGPYAMYLYHAALSLIPYGTIGVIAILLTFAGFLPRLAWLQLAGLLCMWASFIIFFYNSMQNVTNTFKEVLPLLTIILFIVINASVIKKFIQWKNS